MQSSLPLLCLGCVIPKSLRTLISITQIMDFHQKDVTSFPYARDTKRLFYDEMMSDAKSPNFEVQVTSMSRASTLQVSETFSRSSTFKNNNFDLSRSSTFRDEEFDVSRSSTFNSDNSDVPMKPRRGRGSWVWAVVSQVIGLLWLAPITALLVLNYTNFVIGASVWCPKGKCSTDFLSDFTSVVFKKISELDRADHDVLGALQFVSKSLEVWFMFISTSLVYDVAMLFMKKGGGLPVGFLLTHLEFGDIRYLLNPLLWTSPIPHATGAPTQRSVTAKLYLFVGLAASLTILTNLMGPATAVLVIPTLQWVDTPHRPTLIFNGTDSAYGPWANTTFPSCNLKQMDDMDFSCTLDSYGASLDAYAKVVDATMKQSETLYGNPLPVLSQEGVVQFSLNGSELGDILWVPNRHILRELSWDQWAIRDAVYDNTQTSLDVDGARYNNSLQTLLQREGVSLGLVSSCFVGAVTYVVVDDDRAVVCYDNYSPSYIPDASPMAYTKCMKSGFGWDNVTTSVSFHVGDADAEQGQATIITSFATDATFFNDTTDFGSNIRDCVRSDAEAAQCDWDHIFSVEMPDELRSTTKNTLAIEYALSHPATPNNRVWCDSHVHVGFPTYTFDMSMISNPLNLVQLNHLPAVGPDDLPEVFNPLWSLAAWSVGDDGTVPGNRSVAQELLKVLPGLFDEPDDFLLQYAQQKFYLLHQYTLGQALSMVTYLAGNVSDPEFIATASGPTFHRYATLRVWAYGLSDNTSMLGVAVAFLGASCVCCRLILAIIYKFRHEHSTVQMFVAALNHKSQGEFEGLDDEQQLARVRYQLIEDDVGNPMFVPERRHTG